MTLDEIKAQGSQASVLIPLLHEENSDGGDTQEEYIPTIDLTKYTTPNPYKLWHNTAGKLKNNSCNIRNSSYDAFREAIANGADRVIVIYDDEVKGAANTGVKKIITYKQYEDDDEYHFMASGFLRETRPLSTNICTVLVIVPKNSTAVNVYSVWQEELSSY